MFLEQQDQFGRPANLVSPDAAIRALSSKGSDKAINQGNVEGGTQAAKERLQAAANRLLEQRFGTGDSQFQTKAIDDVTSFIEGANQFSGQLGRYVRKEDTLPVRPTYSPFRFGEGSVPMPGAEAPGTATEAVSALGTAASGTSGSLKTLADAIIETANKIRGSSAAPADTTQTIPGRASGGGIDITGGGFIRGPGTTTSDSIPVAKVSNKEYVINAAGTAKAGLAYLDWINAGMPGGGFAEGGTVIPGLLNSALGAGSYDVTPTDDGGAIINGVAYPPGSPILQNPIIKQALARARAARGSSGEGKKHKSDFVGPFGGHVFDTPGSYAKGGATGHIRRGYFAGGSVDFGPAFGGMAELPDLVGEPPNVSDFKEKPGSWPDVDHLGSLDLRHPAGEARVIGPKDALKALTTAARDQSDVSMGSPSWKYGRSY